jgi:cytochrome b pre-mRNA-processing protein 3
MRLPRWLRAASRVGSGGPDLDEDARRLYAHLVAQARAPEFYRELGVPDSLDGRFEMLALHVFLTLRRLKRSGHEPLAQALFDTMFTDMDRSLREIGVGDLSVGKRVKDMAKALYGRIAAYEAGLAERDDAALVKALERNLFGTVAAPSAAAVAALARYLRQAAERLEAAAPAELAAAPPWPAIPIGA